MSVKLNWSFSVAVENGPKLTLNNKPTVVVDAYDVVAATIAAGAVNVNVSLQPSTTAGDVVFLAITSDTYDPGVTFTAGGSTTQLDGPVLLVGAGAVGLLGASPPATLDISNPLTDPIQLLILVGRNV